MCHRFSTLIAAFAALTFLGCVSTSSSLDSTRSRPGGDLRSPTASETDYAANTPDALRAIHREAVESLRNSKWREAYEHLDGASDSRALTDYLKLVALVHLPEEALSADEVANSALHPAEEPSLGDRERASLNRIRAWIAGVQDALGDKAVSKGLPRPVPRDLESSHNLDRLRAWENRGSRYDRPTYEETKRGFTGLSLDLSVNWEELRPQSVNSLLYLDLTGIGVPPLPAVILPAPEDL